MTARTAPARLVNADRPGSDRAAAARRVRRSAAAAYALALPVLGLALAGPAAAAERSDGDSPGQGIGLLETIGIYVGVPLAIYLVIVLLTFAPSTTRGPRYRPGAGWDAYAAWLGGPQDGAASGQDAPGRATGSGGASGSW